MRNCSFYPALFQGGKKGNFENHFETPHLDVQVSNVETSLFIGGCFFRGEMRGIRPVLEGPTPLSVNWVD